MTGPDAPIRPAGFAAAANLAVATGAAAPAKAQASILDCGYGYGHHMGAGGIAGSVGMLLFFFLLVAALALAISLVRWLGGFGQNPRSSPTTPLDILKERFARGEIDQNEFDERRRALGERTGQ